MCNSTTLISVKTCLRLLYITNFWIASTTSNYSVWVFSQRKKKDDKHAIKLIKKIVALKSRSACRHFFLSAWFRWIVGYHACLVSVYWWLVEVHWFTEIDVKSGWTNTRGVEGDWHSSVRINTATSSSCDSYQITSVSAWCLGIVLPLTPSERGWLCLMYIVYHVYSDSILCKKVFCAFHHTI